MPLGECGTKTVPADTIRVTVFDNGGGYSRAYFHFWLKCRNECPPDPPCDCGIRGDMQPPTGDGHVDALDLGAMIDALFAGGRPPLWVETCPVNRGDIIPDGFLDAQDLGYLIDYLFAGGPAPIDPCAAK